MISSNTKITLGFLIGLISLLVSIAFGVDAHVKNSIDPISKRIDYLIKRTDDIYNYLLQEKRK